MFEFRKTEDLRNIVCKTEEVVLDDIVETFSNFLKGCGFYFDKLEVVENEMCD